jgi:transcriptional regulator with XRE-family HTH domain
MDDTKTHLSSRLKALRELRGWSITETARRGDVSVSMLWKVENGQAELTYSKLVSLAAGLEVPIGELFADPKPVMRKGGRRVVDRNGAGQVVDLQENLHRFLAADLAQKHYFPCIVEVKSKSDGTDSEAHGGEEFTFVLEGEVRFFCEGYEPVVLLTGDSVYFDASMPHKYAQASEEPARILCVYSHPEHAQRDRSAGLPAHPMAMVVLGTSKDVGSDGPNQSAHPPGGRKLRRRRARSHG